MCWKPMLIPFRDHFLFDSPKLFWVSPSPMIIGFGAMDVTKPYDCIGFGAMGRAVGK